MWCGKFSKKNQKNYFKTIQCWRQSEIIGLRLRHFSAYVKTFVWYMYEQYICLLPYLVVSIFGCYTCDNKAIFIVCHVLCSKSTARKKNKTQKKCATFLSRLTWRSSWRRLCYVGLRYPVKFNETDLHVIFPEKKNSVKMVFFWRNCITEF